MTAALFTQFSSCKMRRRFLALKCLRIWMFGMYDLWLKYFWLAHGGYSSAKVWVVDIAVHARISEKYNCLHLDRCLPVSSSSPGDVSSSSGCSSGSPGSGFSPPRLASVSSSASSNHPVMRTTSSSSSSSSILSGEGARMMLKLQATLYQDSDKITKMWTADGQRCRESACAFLQRIDSVSYSNAQP